MTVNIQLLSCDGKNTRYPVFDLPRVCTRFALVSKNLLLVDCCRTQRDGGNLVNVLDVTSTRIDDIIHEVLVIDTILLHD